MWFHGALSLSPLCLLQAWFSALCGLGHSVYLPSIFRLDNYYNFSWRKFNSSYRNNNNSWTFGGKLTSVGGNWITVGGNSITVGGILFSVGVNLISDGGHSDSIAVGGNLITVGRILISVRGNSITVGLNSIPLRETWNSYSKRKWTWKRFAPFNFHLKS